MARINTFWVAKDSDGSQFEYREKPDWSPPIGFKKRGFYRGRFLEPSDLGYDIANLDEIKPGERVRVTISLTVDKSTIGRGNA